VGKAYGFDPRETGSHNIGATNVARAGGSSAAAVTVGGDFIKGLIPLIAARTLIGPAPSVLAEVGFATFIGAIASIFLLFKGGRGVATSLGIWAALAPVPILIAVTIFVAVLALSRIVSLASLAAAVLLPPIVAATHSPRPYILLAILMSALVVLRHRENIGRLLRGEERRIGS
jgi:glycerol-3-phosphate acyltransferase PlsY